VWRTNFNLKDFVRAKPMLEQ